MKVDIAGHGPSELPDFLILGAAKGGTSSLFRYLGEHPGIHIPEIKEPWFFSMNFRGEKDVRQPNLGGAVTDIDAYCRLFAPCGEGRITGEASPSYLYTHATTIPNLRAVYPPADLAKLRFFIMLRNPVDRAWSMYWTFARVLKEEFEFERAVSAPVIAARREAGDRLFYDYIGVGRYCAQIRAYLEAFGPDRIKIILFDDLKRDTAGVCRESFAFLGVDPGFAPDTTKVYNVSGRPKNEGFIRFLLSDNPVKSAFKAVVSRQSRRKVKNIIGRKALQKVEMAPATRKDLLDLYRGEILELQDLIGRDLQHWLA